MKLVGRWWVEPIEFRSSLCGRLETERGPLIRPPHKRGFLVVLLSTEESRTLNPESARYLSVSPSPLRPKNILVGPTHQRRRDEIGTGKTTIIIPIAGTEQNGPVVAKVSA
jgi:hypothetical protein